MPSTKTTTAKKSKAIKRTFAALSVAASANAGDNTTTQSALEVASAAVAVACATTTTFVRVLQLNPLVVSPDDLFLRRFKEVGIISDAQMEAFRAVLIQLLPQIMADLRLMPLSPEIVTGLVVDHVEALLLARA